ncbi:hypothetical protein ACQP0C_14480 [Nocardia sp. CA-129566]|uniref:hypothetical protein n=1 Tax=Nocardia sp. CA-129566 TaxID=3239976 RepID=UPI003D971B80
MRPPLSRSGGCQPRLVRPWMRRSGTVAGSGTRTDETGQQGGFAGVDFPVDPWKWLPQLVIGQHGRPGGGRVGTEVV